MQCAACLREKEICARGLCAACYQRWRKTGSTEYQRWGKKSYCHIDGCGKEAQARGLCQMHYTRLVRHGSTDVRDDGRGAAWKHPLRHSWYWMHRYRTSEQIAPEWRDDFLQFIADVGERPSKAHKLYAADDGKPLGPNNFVWKESLIQRVAGEDDKTYRNRLAKANRAVRQEAFQDYGLKKLYGLGRGEYEQRNQAQGGRCAICGDEEITVIRGKKIGLSVDHCHVSGKVRDLLCRACNNILGDAKDDPERLRRAIAYLERHKSTQ